MEDPDAATFSFSGAIQLWSLKLGNRVRVRVGVRLSLKLVNHIRLLCVDPTERIASLA